MKLVGRLHRVKQRERCGIRDVRSTSTDIHALRTNNFSNVRVILNNTITTQQNSYSVPYSCVDLSHTRLSLYHRGDHNAASKSRASRARGCCGWRMFCVKNNIHVILRCVIPVVLSNINNKLMVHMYIVKNTTIFLIVRLLLIRYNYMFRPSMLAIFRLHMKHLTISYIYT